MNDGSWAIWLLVGFLGFAGWRIYKEFRGNSDE